MRQCADALRRKGNTVVMLIQETFGGLAPTGAIHLHRMAKKASKKHGRDSTRYTISWTAHDYWSHHAQSISAAPVYEDARTIQRAAAYARARTVAAG